MQGRPSLPDDLNSPDDDQHKVDGWSLFGRELRVGWAHHANGNAGQREPEEDGTSLFVVSCGRSFVSSRLLTVQSIQGDLAPEIDDAVLFKTFRFNSV